MGHVTSKMTERYFDPLSDNGAGTAAVASLLGVEDGAVEGPTETTPSKSNGRLTLADEKPFGPTPEMLRAEPTESHEIKSSYLPAPLV